MLIRRLRIPIISEQLLMDICSCGCRAELPAGAVPEVKQHQNITPQPNSQKYLSVPGVSHPAIMANGCQEGLVHESQPVPRTADWPLGQPQLVAAAQPAQAVIPIEKPVPLQQASLMDMGGTAESCLQDRRAVSKGMVDHRLEEAARYGMPEKSQSQVSGDRRGQVTPSDQRLALTSSKPPQTRHRIITQEGNQKRSKENDKYVYVKNVKYEKIALLGKGGSSRVCFILKHFSILFLVV